MGYAFIASLTLHLLAFSGLIPFPFSSPATREKEVKIEIEVENEPAILPSKESFPFSQKLPIKDESSLPRPLPIPPKEEMQSRESPIPEEKLVRGEEKDFLQEELPSSPKSLQASSATPNFEEALIMKPPPKVEDERKRTLEKVEKKEASAYASSQTPPVKVPDPIPKIAATPPSEADVLSRYAGVVRKKIEEKRRYPPWARRNGWQGKVVLDFVIRSDGHLNGVEVVESSGHQILDESGKEAIQRATPFPPLPMEEKKSLKLRIPVVFKLEKES